MKARILVLGTLAALSISPGAKAITLFADSFQSNDLNANWSGNELGCSQGRSASIFADPKNTGQYAVGFNQGNCGSDIVTTHTFSATSGHFILTFDYLNNVGTNGAGGFLGLVEGGSFIQWLEMDASGYGQVQPYGQWTHITVDFSASSPIQLSIEQWSDLYTTPGTALYKNLVLTDEAGPSSTGPVPEPMTLSLLGTGLLGLGAARRRKAAVAE